MAALIEECYPFALSRASLEAFGEVYDETALAHKVDKDEICKEALTLIQQATFV